MKATRSSLLSRVRDFEDDAAWSEFDKLYRPMLVGYALRRGLAVSEAEEIAQHCLAEIVPRIKKFRRERGFRSWLRGMVDHKVSDCLAQRRRQRPLDTKLLGQTPAGDGSADQIWQEIWNQSHLTECVNSIRAEFAEHTFKAFAMYVFQNEEVATICRRLGMTPNQVYVAKSRVLARVRMRLGPALEMLYGTGS
ncbi:MAG: RNA polymerase sigma factor [Planctomycetota bacterium]|jgi:RNA polymerase sigma-70 factor (ECF subfamily)